MSAAGTVDPSASVSHASRSGTGGTVCNSGDSATARTADRGTATGPAGVSSRTAAPGPGGALVSVPADRARAVRFAGTGPLTAWQRAAVVRDRGADDLALLRTGGRVAGELTGWDPPGPGSAARLDTPAGPVSFTLVGDGHTVEVTNVPSFRHAAGVELDVGRGGCRDYCVGRRDGNGDGGGERGGDE